MGNNSRWYLAYKYWKKTKLSKFRGKPINETFKIIYEKNFWKSQDSLSGLGSDNVQTDTIVIEIPRIVEKYKILTIHDIPCGDYNWMQNIDLKRIKYLGSDIVPEIIEQNIKYYGSESVAFKTLDLTSDPLPKMDLTLVRDCLVHFSFHDTKKALLNLIKSGSKYLLTTSFVDREKNYNIATGEWRPINLGKPPYNFPDPLEIINENCTQDDGAYPDKSLLLYKINDLKSVDFLLN